jgi:hypothetical protein
MSELQGVASSEAATEGTPSIARIRDHWLGGSHHTDADRVLADHILVCAPHLPYLVRSQRTMLARVVRYLLEQGVRQFLDLGSGVPTTNHVHEVAQAADPECRVVYVDVEDGVADEGRELVADNPRAAYLCADISDPRQVLESAEVRELLDFDQPVAVLLIETLLHIPDAADPAAVVANYVEAMSSGSYLVLAHFGEDDQLNAGLNMFSELYGAPPAVTLRDPVKLKDFFTGVDLVEPGIVPVTLWHPDPDDVGFNPEAARIYVGVGRKP